MQVEATQVVLDKKHKRRTCAVLGCHRGLRITTHVSDYGTVRNLRMQNKHESTLTLSSD